jgi:hypothetical protein
MLPVFLGFPFLIASSVFSNIYLCPLLDWCICFNKKVFLDYNHIHLAMLIIILFLEMKVHFMKKSPFKSFMLLKLDSTSCSTFSKITMALKNYKKDKIINRFVHIEFQYFIYSTYKGY